MYLYKSQIRPRMEYCSHIWAGSSKTILSTLDRVQRRMRGLGGEKLFASLQSLSHLRNVASLSHLYRYVYGKCSDELHLLVPEPPVRDFPIKTRFAKSSEAHLHFLKIATPRCKFHSDSFFPRTAAMWNSLPPECFPPEYNLDLFNSRVSKFAA